MRQLIIRKNGITIDHRSKGVELLSFRKSGINNEFGFESVDGRRGEVPSSSQKKGRNLRATFLLKGEDFEDLELLIDEMYEVFDTNKSLIIIDTLQPGKQWEVVPQGEIADPERLNYTTAKMEVVFFSGYPYCRSVGTSLNPLTFDSNLWQIGQGLVASEMSYTHSTNYFNIYNPSAIDIVPWEHPLVISIKGEAKNIELINISTGDIFTYNGELEANDTLIINKIQHLKNGVSCMSQTNRKDITLAVGNNNFKLSGINGVSEVKFDFPFYYV